MLLSLVLCLACALAAAAAQAYSVDEATQDGWLLENGAPETWAPALRRLMAERYLRKEAVASVLRRMDVLQGKDRVKLCQSLSTALHDPRALEALVQLARDPEEAVRDAARTALADRSIAVAPETLLALAAEPGEARVRFIRAWEHRYSDAMALKRSPRRAAFAAQTGGRREDQALAVLSRLMLDTDERIADAATEAMSLLVDTRVEDLFVQQVAAGGVTALFQLAKRGDPRAFEPMVQWGRERSSREKGDFDRRKVLEQVGSSLPPLYFPRLVAFYRAGDTEQKRQARSMFEGHVGLAMLDEASAMQEVRTLAGDPDEFLRGQALKVLEWEHHREAERSAPQKARRTVLVGASLAGILVGVVLYLLAFRLLVLKRFVRGLPVQNIRSVPPGLVALQGEVQPFEQSTTTHPFTGEKCVVFENTRMPFFLADATGRVLVNPQGAALLSEDHMLVPGEKILVVGTLRQGARASDGAAERSISRRDHELAWFTRITGWVVRAATGLLLGRNAARMMFLNERQCLWIWDDLDERPFVREREAAGMTAGLLFTGAWILVFIGAALGLAG